MPDGIGYSEAEAARIIGIGARTLRRWRRAGAVAHSITPGGRVRYSLEDIWQLQSAMHVRPQLGRI